MIGPNRRRFLQSSLAAGATFAISGTKSSGNILGANDRLRVAVAGLHGRGRSHYGAYAKMKDVEVAYVVDPDSRQFARAINDVKNISGTAPKPIGDVREVLDDNELNIVSIATPNHWHSLMSIWACQAGKDVYVEKPVSHNVSEGRRIVQAARKYGKIVQTGTQCRSMGGTIQAIDADNVFVDIGMRANGIVPRRQWDKSEPEVGQVIEVYLENVEDQVIYYLFQKMFLKIWV